MSGVQVHVHRKTGLLRINQEILSLGAGPGSNSIAHLFNCLGFCNCSATHHRDALCSLTPSLPWYHLANKSANSETLNPFCLLFRIAMWKDFYQNACIESRCVKGPQNILFGCSSVYLSARKFYKPGAVKGLIPSGWRSSLWQDERMNKKKDFNYLQHTRLEVIGYGACNWLVPTTVHHSAVTSVGRMTTVTTSGWD